MKQKIKRGKTNTEETAEEEKKASSVVFNSIYFP